MKDVIIIAVMFVSLVIVGGMFRSGNGYALTGWSMAFIMSWFCLVLSYRIDQRDKVLKAQEEYFNNLQLNTEGPSHDNH
jgi:hypothetical protein